MAVVTHYCGAEVPPGATFCLGCGNEVSPWSTPPPPPPPGTPPGTPGGVLTCPDPLCGRSMPDGAAVCPYCGTAMVSPACAHVRLLMPDGTARELVPEAPTLLGRLSPDEVVARHVSGFDGVSREHAELLAHSDGSITVRDLGSLNGTYVDDALVSGVLTVCPGVHTIRLGQRCILRVEMGTP
jgi:hypothetical protein